MYVPNYVPICYLVCPIYLCIYPVSVYLSMSHLSLCILYLVPSTSNLPLPLPLPTFYHYLPPTLLPTIAPRSSSLLLPSSAPSLRLFITITTSKHPPSPSSYQESRGSGLSHLCPLSYNYHSHSLCLHLHQPDLTSNIFNIAFNGIALH